jgi:hypothetical protein
MRSTETWTKFYTSNTTIYGLENCSAFRKSGNFLIQMKTLFECRKRIEKLVLVSNSFNDGSARKML